MTPLHRQILAQAMELPSSDRGRLAAMLIESLESEVDDDANQAWAEEIRNRVEDVKQGRVKLIPWSEVRSRMKGSDESGD